MATPRISLVAAMSSNRVIGVQNKLPWNIPEDLKRFRVLTTDHVIVMGRKTYESIGRPLPNRENRVVTYQKDYSPQGVKIFKSLSEALETPIPDTMSPEEIFVIGGGEIYRQALPLADRIYLTVIDRDYEGDAFFPDFSNLNFVEVASEKFAGPLPFLFLTLDKR